MEVTTRAVGHVELITVKGRVDSVEAVRLEEALTAAQHRGRYRLVIDMSQLEYMSSAGFRALASAQRNSKRHEHGEVVFTQVPVDVREALEMVGFTAYFKIIDPPSAALEYAEKPPADDSRSKSLPATPEA